MSVFIYQGFARQLNAAFADQLKAGAAVVSGKVNVNPRIVPLPHGDEHFTIIYRNSDVSDTLYADDSFRGLLFKQRDSTFTYDNFRGITYIAYPENGGFLKIFYALPAVETEKRLNTMLLLLMICIPVGIMLAAALAYRLAGRILTPVMQVIRKANSTDLRGATSGVIDATSRDTELQELSDSFNRMISRISEQSQRQSAFFAAASHELRTPLSVMQTRLQVMQQQDLAHADEHFLKDQLTEVKRLTKMVNDFLLMTELQQGNMSVIKEAINLTEIIPEIVALYQQKSSAKYLAIDMVFLPQDADFIISADKDKLQSMFSNLIDNAIKYSPDKGKITLNCREENSRYKIFFSNDIRDDIDPDLSAITKEFYHSKPLRGEGVGLGLWITYALAELQGIIVTTEIVEQRFVVSMIIGK